MCFSPVVTKMSTDDNMKMSTDDNMASIFSKHFFNFSSLEEFPTSVN